MKKNFIKFFIVFCFSLIVCFGFFACKQNPEINGNSDNKIIYTVTYDSNGGSSVELVNI